MKRPTIQTLGGGAPLRPEPTITNGTYRLSGETLSLDIDAAVLGMLWETVYSRYLAARGKPVTTRLEEDRYAMLVATLVSFEEAAGVKHAADKRAKPIDRPRPSKKPQPVAKPRIIRRRGN